MKFEQFGKMRNPSFKYIHVEYGFLFVSSRVQWELFTLALNRSQRSFIIEIQ